MYRSNNPQNRMKLTRKMENEEYAYQSIQSGSALLKDARIYIDIPL